MTTKTLSDIAKNTYLDWKGPTRKVWEAVAEAVAAEVERRNTPCECMGWGVSLNISKRDLERRREVGHHADCPQNPDNQVKP